MLPVRRGVGIPSAEISSRGNMFSSPFATKNPTKEEKSVRFENKENFERVSVNGESVRKRGESCY